MKAILFVIFVTLNLLGAFPGRQMAMPVGGLQRGQLGAFWQRARAVQGSAPVGSVPVTSPPVSSPAVAIDPTILSAAPSGKYFIPDALKFIEPLVSHIRPDQVVIMSGGDSPLRRASGFAKLSADSMIELCRLNGYSLAFMDELDYDKTLTYKGTKFHPTWHRVFALPALRRRFPDAMYIVYMDDDILVPYPETHMINHWINKMEEKPEWEMLYGEEGADYVLNSGMFFFKNKDYPYDAYAACLDIGLERYGYLARNFGHEQGAIIEWRKRNQQEGRILVLPHRDGIYNFNNFARFAGHDRPGTRTRDGDAFVHFTGLNPQDRLKGMQALKQRVMEWRLAIPRAWVFPMDTLGVTKKEIE